MDRLMRQAVTFIFSPSAISKWLERQRQLNGSFHLSVKPSDVSLLKSKPIKGMYCGYGQQANTTASDTPSLFNCLQDTQLRNKFSSAVPLCHSHQHSSTYHLHSYQAHITYTPITIHQSQTD